MDATGHTHIMLDHRSPNFLWLVAGIALTLSVGAWLLFDQTPVAWVLIVIAFAAGVEASTSQAAAQIGAVYFDQDSEDVERRAFSPRGALFRCGYLGCFGFAAVFLGSGRSEEHTSELQSLMRISYAVFCLK